MNTLLKLILLIAIASRLPAQTLIRFDWVDNFGSAGTLTFDPSKGFSSEAIIEIQYVDYNGDAQDLTANSFHSFAESKAWDINTGIEGVDFSWDVAIFEPLPTDPSYYQTNFASGNFISIPGHRLWDELVVSVVPEFRSTPALFGVSIFVLAVIKRSRKRANK